MVRKQAIEVIGINEIPEFWNVLTEDQKAYLQANITLQHYKKNELIHKEGGEPTHMMILVRGKVKIYKSGVGGRSQIMRMLKPYEYFGYRAIFAHGNFHGYNTNARAFESCSIYKIPATVITDLLQQNAKLAFSFVQRLAADLGASDARMVNLTQKHIRGRLAETLLFLKESYGLEADGATINIYLAREDIANLSNMNTSNAIRTLSTFATEGIIAVDGRKIKIIDEERLHKISRLG
ncbi:MAG: Crp/Fnr family transcriptional regulator [Prevotellaceae bacterium]|jgi:CRP-like cAMP-binding protein|nr:Crp/Fnr family transcriptional regulator [Prevotellaceae bacterium]